MAERVGYAAANEAEPADKGEKGLTDLKIFRRRLRDGVTYLSQWRREAQKTFDFYASEQWAGDDKEKREDRGEPTITHNQFRLYVDGVSGQEITARFQPTFEPVDPSVLEAPQESVGAEMLSGTLRWTRKKGDWDVEDSAVFRNTVQCGVGVARMTEDYLEHPDGVTLLDRLNPLDAVWDWSAKKPGYTDRRWTIVEYEIPRHEFVSRWPDYEGLVYNADSTLSRLKTRFVKENTIASLRYSPDQGDNASTYDPKRDMVHVFFYECWWPEDAVRVYPPQGEGEPFFVDMDEFPQFKQKLEMDIQLGRTTAEAQGQPVPAGVEGWDFVKMTRKKFYESWILGTHTVLEESESELDRFSILFSTGFEHQHEDGRITHFGLGQLMIDPQRWWNSFWSQAMYIWSKQGKDAVFYRQGSFVNEASFGQNYSRPSAPIAVKQESWDSANGKAPIDIPRSNGLPAALGDLIQFATSSFSVVGVNREYFLATVDDLKRTAGSAVSSIQQKVIENLSVLFDSFRIYRREQARTFLAFVRLYMPDGQIMRITNSQGDPQIVQFARNQADQEYDIEVGEEPASKSERSRAADHIFQHGAFQELARLGLVGPKMLGYLLPDAPTEVIQEMVQLYEAQRQATQQGPQPGGQPPNPNQG